METSLNRSVITGLAYATSLGLLVAVPSFAMAKGSGNPLQINSYAADPNDDDRGSGRVVPMGVNPLILGWRGSGRINPEPAAASARRLFPPTVQAYRGTGRLKTTAYRGTGRARDNDHSEPPAYRGTGRLSQDSIGYRGAGRISRDQGTSKAV
jgi:hypothetical protein